MIRINLVPNFPNLSQSKMDVPTLVNLIKKAIDVVEESVYGQMEPSSLDIGKIIRQMGEVD